MCSRSELVHYIYLAIPGSIDTIVSDLFTPSFREGWCRSLFLPLVAHVQQYNTVEISLFVARCWCYRSLLTIFSGKQWPFPMVAEINGTPERYSYTPRSDILLRLQGCPFVLVEVTSDPYKKDLYRMLIQAGIAVRLSNSMKTDTTKSFVVMAVYINEHFHAERHLVYQPDLQSENVHIGYAGFPLLKLFVDLLPQGSLRPFDRFRGRTVLF